jgi:toxin ParE1/3/4
MLLVVFSPIARAELNDAYEWYAQRSEDAAAWFITEIEAVVARIAETPQQFPVIEDMTRRARLRHFPYALFFRVRDEAIRITACFHDSREPRRWRARR